LDVVLIGAGRVGTAVAVLLQRGGYRVAGVASRSPESAKRAGDLLEAPVSNLSGLPAADLALVGVPEGALEEVGEQVAAVRAGRIVCHFAGAVGINPLRAVTGAGMQAAALHPVQSCPDVDTAIARLPGSAWGITASPDVATWAAELVEKDLGGLPFDVAEQDRPVWHAAAVTTANGTAALLALGEAMLARIGIDRPEAVLGPLLAGTLANARTEGAVAALTGPVVRGEAATVRSHLDALAAVAPDLLEPYRAASRIVLMAAAKAGRIEAAVADSIDGELER
jgi:predicted short-subunit dehydrogenase-like oxidoreductase (DUF2520 family)